jgi:hypothetical protein
MRLAHYFGSEKDESRRYESQHNNTQHDIKSGTVYSTNVMLIVVM